MTLPIVVAGATGGMGAAIVIDQLRQGHPVVALGRSPAKLEALRARAEQATHLPDMPELFTCQVEITDPQDCARAAAELMAQHGALGGYVHAAGIGHCGALMQTADADWSEAFAIKVGAAARMIRLLMPALAGHRASIVLIGGVFAKEPNGLFAINSTLNAAIAGLGKSLSAALRKSGIRVNVLHPGATDTPQWAQLAAEAGQILGLSADQITAATAAQLIGNRLLDPDEVGAAVSFLTSPRNRSLTGACLVLDGGETRAL